MVVQWPRCCATNRKVAGSIPAGVIGIFHWPKILPIAIWPWDRLSLYRNEYQEHFLGVKGGRCIRLTTLPPSCAVVMISGNLNFQEPSGPLQAFFHYHLTTIQSNLPTPGLFSLSSDHRPIKSAYSTGLARTYYFLNLTSKVMHFLLGYIITLQ